MIKHEVSYQKPEKYEVTKLVIFHRGRKGGFYSPFTGLRAAARKSVKRDVKSPDFSTPEVKIMLFRLPGCNEVWKRVI